AKRADSLVNVGHELVKMRASLANHGTCFEEQVHQQGLAAADVAGDVEALDRLVLRPAAEQPADRPRPACRAVRGDAPLQRHELHQQALLRTVALELLGGEQVFVKLEGGHRGGPNTRGWRSGHGYGLAAQPASNPTNWPSACQPC